MKFSIFTALFASLLLFSACDEGRIPEKQPDLTEKGRVAHIDAKLEGAGTWSSQYTLVLAGFEENNAYAKIARNITLDANGETHLTLTGIPEEVKTIELCVISSIRRRMVSFYSVEVPSTATDADTIQVKPEATLNVGMFAAIQSNIFNKQCANCHSGNAWAASLNLNDGQSYAELLNIASKKEEGKDRVTPGNADSSVLYEALATEVSTGWKHDHSKIFESDYYSLELIKDWINNGAKE